MSEIMPVTEQINLLVEVLSRLPPEIWNNVPDAAWALFWYNLFDQIWVQEILRMLATAITVYLVTIAFSKIIYAFKWWNVSLSFNSEDEEEPTQ